MKTAYEKYAELLVRYSLDIKPGDKLLVVSTYLSEPLVREVYKEALRAGAHPETWIALNGITRALYDVGSDAQLRHVSPLFLHAVQHFQAVLTIRAPFNTKELQTVDPAKKEMTAVAETDMKKIFRERAAAGDLKWTICEFPTDAQAQECGLSRADYERFVLDACFVNDPDPQARWRDVHNAQQHVVDFLNTKERIRFKGSDIDMAFSTRGRRWINSDGRHNMPSGEIFTSPVDDSVEGYVRFSYPGIYMAQEIEDVRLEVRAGRVVSAQAAKGKELLETILRIPGADRFGEAAIGTNKGITRFTKNILFDEKIGGTIHMALGSAYGEAGGTNQSPVHWDLIADMATDGEIHADGEVIYRKGDFLI